MPVHDAIPKRKRHNGGNRSAINRIMTHAVMRPSRLFNIFKINEFNYSIHVYYVSPDLTTFMRTIFYISSSAYEK